jgi:hypothetical protein
MSVRVLSAAVGLVAILAGGCGGSSPDSMSQLRSQASGICSAASGRMARIATPRRPPASLAFLDRGVAVLEPELRQLRMLRAPAASDGVYAVALTGFAAQLSALSRAASALGHQQDPVRTLQALQRRLAPLETETDDAWRALQIPACASR